MGKWEMVRLGDVCEINPKNQPLDDYAEVSFIPMASVSENGEIDVSQKALYKDVKKGFTSFGIGDVLFAKITPCMENGKGGIVNKLVNERGFGSTEFHVLRSDIKRLSPEWLFLFTHWSKFRKLAESNMTGSAGQKRVPKSFLSEIFIPLPFLDEQKRIAKNLDLASEIVKGYKEQLAELDKLVQSVFYEMFGDPVTNEKGWDCAPLSKTARIVTGNTPPRNCKENYGCHIEWIKTDNITDSLYVTQASEYLSARGASIGRLVDADAILMACIAGSIKSIGRVAIANRVVAFNQQINAVIANKYDTLFLYCLFKMTQEYIQSTINMSLKGILSKGKLEKLVFIVPPLPLQTRFASIVTEIEAQKAQVQQALTEAENLFGSLMQEYFE